MYAHTFLFMQKILVINGHPNLEQSFTNRPIIEGLQNWGEVELTVRHLTDTIQNGIFDPEPEQQALLDADVVVLQFPFYWYSVPGILKQWLDDVLLYGFAYGSTGDKLKGKDLLLSLTIGGPNQAYTPLGSNHFPIDELLKPMEQTAYLTGMKWHSPIRTHGMVFIPGVYNSQEAVEERAQDHLVRLKSALTEILQEKEPAVAGDTI